MLARDEDIDLLRTVTVRSLLPVLEQLAASGLRPRSTFRRARSYEQGDVADGCFGSSWAARMSSATDVRSRPSAPAI